jgi:hypothetical protein
MVAIAASLHLPEYSQSAFHQSTWHRMVYINPLSRLKEFVLGMLFVKLFMA